MIGHYVTGGAYSNTLREFWTYDALIRTKRHYAINELREKLADIKRG